MVPNPSNATCSNVRVSYKIGYQRYNLISVKLKWKFLFNFVLFAGTSLPTAQENIERLNMPVIGDDDGDEEEENNHSSDEGMLWYTSAQ